VSIAARLPANGWDILSIADMKEDCPDCEHHCEYCGTAIRFVYTIAHPQVIDTLDVGSECAHRMSSAYSPATDKQMRASSRRKEARKKNWAKGWAESTNGNLTRKSDAGRITIYSTRVAGWKFVLSGKHSELSYETQREAMEASFETYWELIK
jgi:hypothetical protein